MNDPSKRSKTMLELAVELGVKIPSGTSEIEMQAMVDDALAEQRLRLSGHRNDPQIPARRAVPVKPNS